MSPALQMRDKGLTTEPSEHDPVVSRAARHLLPVEVLEQRDDVLARQAGQVLEGRRPRSSTPARQRSRTCCLSASRWPAVDEEPVPHPVEDALRDQHAADALEELRVRLRRARRGPAPRRPTSPAAARGRQDQLPGLRLAGGEADLVRGRGRSCREAAGTLPAAARSASTRSKADGARLAEGPRPQLLARHARLERLAPGGRRREPRARRPPAGRARPWRRRRRGPARARRAPGSPRAPRRARGAAPSGAPRGRAPRSRRGPPRPPSPPRPGRRSRPPAAARRPAARRPSAAARAGRARGRPRSSRPASRSAAPAGPRGPRPSGPPAAAARGRFSPARATRPRAGARGPGPRRSRRGRAPAPRRASARPPARSETLDVDHRRGLQRPGPRQHLAAGEALDGAGEVHRRAGAGHRALDRRAVHLQAAHPRAPSGGERHDLLAHRELARHESTGDHGAEALHREDPVDGQAEKALRGAGGRLAGEGEERLAERGAAPPPSGRRRAPPAGRPGTTPPPAPAPRARRAPWLSGSATSHFVSTTRPRGTPRSRQMWKCSRVCGITDSSAATTRSDRVDAVRARQHVAHEPLVAGHVHEGGDDAVRRAPRARSRGRS